MHLMMELEAKQVEDGIAEGMEEVPAVEDETELSESLSDGLLDMIEQGEKAAEFAAGVAHFGDQKDIKQVCLAEKQRFKDAQRLKSGSDPLEWWKKHEFSFPGGLGFKSARGQFFGAAN